MKNFLVGGVFLFFVFGLGCDYPSQTKSGAAPENQVATPAPPPQTGTISESRRESDPILTEKEIADIRDSVRRTPSGSSSLTASEKLFVMGSRVETAATSVRSLHWSELNDKELKFILDANFDENLNTKGSDR